MDNRPFRSVLYIPASKPRAMDKARGLACDAIIFDLEDAVAVDEKPAARALLARTDVAGQRFRPAREAVPDQRVRYRMGAR